MIIQFGLARIYAKNLDADLVPNLVNDEADKKINVSIAQIETSVDEADILST